MAREFGKRSYDPEVIHFAANGSQPSGLPWNGVRRKIPVNILCEANNNPSTVEELSVALGIALPYMEEEVAILTEYELLKKLEDGRYITNFFIYPAECLNEINKELCTYSEKVFGKVWDAAKKAYAAENGTLCDTSALGEEDATMYFAFIAIDRALRDGGVKMKSYKRRDGGDWGFCGYEYGDVCRLDKEVFSNNGSVGKDGDSAWGGYQKVYPTERFGQEKYKTGNGCPENTTLSTLRLIFDGVE